MLQKCTQNIGQQSLVCVHVGLVVRLGGKGRISHSVPLHSRATRLPGTVPNSHAVASNRRVQALSDLSFNVGRPTADHEASVNSGKRNLDKHVFHVARCDGPGVSVFHGPQSLSIVSPNSSPYHDPGRALLNAFQCIKATPMVVACTSGSAVALPSSVQNPHHQSQNMIGVDGGSWVSSGPVALPHEKPTVEDKQTPRPQKAHHSFTYHTLQSIHRCPAVISKRQHPVQLPPQLPHEMRRTLQNAGNSSLHDSDLRLRPYCFSHS